MVLEPKVRSDTTSDSPSSMITPYCKFTPRSLPHGKGFDA